MPRSCPAALLAVLGLLALPGAVAQPAIADPLLDLGRALFFEPGLSLTGQQSCASCHDPANGFASATAFPSGAKAGHFGKRKPPSLAYQALSPVFHHRVEDGEILFIGGDMVDGRALLSNRPFCP
jgi:cytochrome c peroxidase